MQIARTLLLCCAFFIFFVLSYLAFLSYQGSLAILCLFNNVYLILIILILPKPRSYGFMFVAIFLFLGFWLKFTVHMIYEYNFVEPIGNFDFMPENWDRVLFVASFAAIGVIIVRVYHILIRKSLCHNLKSAEAAKIPKWYKKNYKIIWLLSILFALSVHFINYKYSFYKTGINPVLILPAKINVIMSWLPFMGVSMWFAMLINWEVLSRENSTALPFFLPIGEGFLASVSMASRAALIFHVLPYAVVISDEKRNIFKRISPIKKSLGVLLFFVIFALSLSLISWYRLSNYSAGGQFSYSDIIMMAKQVSQLFIDRWIGLEAVLAVSSWPDIGLNLFIQGVFEDPSIGVNSIYQTISNSPYMELKSMTFLTLPGAVAVLFYSGSITVVFCGMIFFSTLLLICEIFVTRLLRNPFLTAIICLGLANALCQMNFPYLFMIFFIELILTVFLFYLLQTPLLAKGRN